MAGPAWREHVVRRSMLSAMTRDPAPRERGTTKTAPPGKSSPKSQPPPAPPMSSAAWQLIHDDVLDRNLDDDELIRLIAERGKVTPEPHAELMRLLGMSLREGEARAM